MSKVVINKRDLLQALKSCNSKRSDVWLDAEKVSNLIRRLTIRDTHTTPHTEQIKAAITAAKKYLKQGGEPFVKTMDEIACAFHISRKTLYNWRSDELTNIGGYTTTSKNRKCAKGYDIAGIIADFERYVYKVTQNAKRR